MTAFPLNESSPDAVTGKHWRRVQHLNNTGAAPASVRRGVELDIPALRHAAQLQAPDETLREMVRTQTLPDAARVQSASPGR